VANVDDPGRKPLRPLESGAKVPRKHQARVRHSLAEGFENRERCKQAFVWRQYVIGNKSNDGCALFKAEETPGFLLVQVFEL
jgi:hypothetical protein